MQYKFIIKAKIKLLLQQSQLNYYSTFVLIKIKNVLFFHF
nr:MAG TPA: hypothetical protein [Caudoviricetes sp.]